MNLDRGTVISNANMVTRDVPGEFVPADVITPDRFDVARNQRLAHPVSEGHPLLRSHWEGRQTPSFSGELPPSDMRAITVPTDEIAAFEGNAAGRSRRPLTAV